MTKILHVITGLKTGGAEMMLYKILSASTQFESAVLCLSPDRNSLISNRISDCGITIHYLDISKKINPFLLLKKIRGIVREEAPDVIQGWMYHGNIAALFCSIFSKADASIIWNVRRSLHDLKTEKFTTRCIIKFNALLSFIPGKIIFNSDVSRQQHFKIGFNKKKSVLIPNGFDLNSFKPNLNARIRIRQELSIKNNEIVIGLVGRYHPIKGYSNFLNAANILSTRFNNIKYVLVGKDVDDNNSELIALINRLGIKERVILLGSRTDIPDVTNAFDIATSASSGEAFSNTLGEAMCTEVPCVATDVGESRQLVKDFGVIVKANSPEALADGLAKLISWGKEVRKQIGSEARQHMKQNYSLEAITEMYASLYNNRRNGHVK